MREKLGFLTVFCLLLLAPVANGAMLTVGDASVPHGEQDLTVGIIIDHVEDLYAYELHLEITPLTGQDPSTLYYVVDKAKDVVLSKNGSVFPNQLSNGLAATLFGTTEGVNASDELVAEFTFHMNASSSGSYEIGIIGPGSASFLVDGDIANIPFSVAEGTLTVVPEPGTIILTLAGMVFVARRRDRVLRT